MQTARRQRATLALQDWRDRSTHAETRPEAVEMVVQWLMRTDCRGPQHSDKQADRAHSVTCGSCSDLDPCLARNVDDDTMPEAFSGRRELGVGCHGGRLVAAICRHRDDAGRSAQRSSQECRPDGGNPKFCIFAQLQMPAPVRCPHKRRQQELETLAASPHRGLPKDRQAFPTLLPKGGPWSCEFILRSGGASCTGAVKSGAKPEFPRLFLTRLRRCRASRRIAPFP